MKKTALHEDRAAAIVQWNAMYTLVNSLERRLSITQDKLYQAKLVLELVDRTEIDALYEENQRLTNILERMDKK